MNQDLFAARPSQAPPHQHPPGLFYTWFHGNCRRCNHWHDGTRKLLSKDSTKHMSISCDRCQNKIFGLGRRETHTSLLSQETIQSLTRDAVARQPAICTNDAWDEISPRQSESFFRPMDLEAGSAAQLPEQSDSYEPSREPIDAAKSDETTRPYPSEQQLEKLENSEFNINTAPESPQNVFSFEAATVTQHTPLRPSRRVKYFNRVTKSVGRLLGLDVQISASRIQSPVSSASSLDPPAAPFQRSGNENVASAPQYAVHDVTAAGRLQPRRRSAAEALSESPTLRNSMRVDEPNEEDADEEQKVQHRKQDSSRMFKINKIRSERTNSVRVVYCRCDSECACKLPSAPSMPEDIGSIDIPPPSLASDSRTNSDMTDASLSGGSPAPSIRQSVLLRNAGAGFDALAGRRSRHMSGASRPSRLSSVVHSEASSAESRPGSAAGPPFLPALPHPSPPILTGACVADPARHRASLEHMEQLPSLMLHTQITEEPRSEHDLNSASSLTPRPRSISESNESVTPTQESIDVDEEFRRRAKQGRHKSVPSGSSH